MNSFFKIVFAATLLGIGFFIVPNYENKAIQVILQIGVGIPIVWLVLHPKKIHIHEARNVSISRILENSGECEHNCEVSSPYELLINTPNVEGVKYLYSIYGHQVSRETALYYLGAVCINGTWTFNMDINVRVIPLNTI